jgi:membrane protease YdiL (CAAX protease family)
MCQGAAKNGLILQRVRYIGIAALASFGVAAVGSVVWSALLVANARTSKSVPWSVPVMAVVLAAYWWWLSGHGWPARTGAARARLLRARRVSRAAFIWSLIGGALALVALAGLWIILVQLTGNGGNPTQAQLDGYPGLFVALAILMGSLVSPLTEEAAFRGYGQVLLERHFVPITAVGISSLFFTLWHGPTQGFFWSKLLFFLLVGVTFGAIAYLTDSTLPAIPVHIAGDLLFFIFIWPQDSHRILLSQHGPDLWFWIHAVQFVAFSGLAVIAFWSLSLLRPAHPSGRTSS